MASAHYTRDVVSVVHVSLSSFDIPYQKYKDLGIGLVYLNASDPAFTNSKRQSVVANGLRCGIFVPRSSNSDGGIVANAVASAINTIAPNDSGQTPVLLDIEPSNGSGAFWSSFIPAYRELKPGRVTDVTVEPFKASVLPSSDFVNARFDIKVQYYFGDMSPVDGGEARDDWLAFVPREYVRGFVDGGRVIKPPMYYQGRRVRNLQPGTAIWNSNLLREAGLV